MQHKVHTKGLNIMTHDTSTWRNAMCQSLIAAGKTSAEEIIAEVSKLETFVFSNTISHPAEAKAVQVLEQAQAAEPEPVVETEAEAVAATVTYTRDDVKSALMQVAKKSRDDLAAILSKFNVTNISSIQESDFAEVIQLAENANA